MLYLHHNLCRSCHSLLSPVRWSCDTNLWKSKKNLDTRKKCWFEQCDFTIWAAARQSQQKNLCTQWRQISLGIRPVWSVFAVRMKKAWVLIYPLSTLQRLIRLGGCLGWFGSLLGTQIILLVLSWGGSYGLCPLELETYSSRDKPKSVIHPKDKPDIFRSKKLVIGQIILSQDKLSVLWQMCYKFVMEHNFHMLLFIQTKLQITAI